MSKFTKCLIVKNEERNLPCALSWGKKLFDELIVVDTGSNDGTVALAEKLGAKVLRFKWINDFSAARNFAISQCAGDWIFFLDADEYLKEEDIPILQSLIEKLDKHYSPEKSKKRYYNVIETPWVSFGNGHQSLSRQARIFRNVPFLRYAGQVHEQLHALPGGYLKAYPVKDAASIYHTGYLWSEDNSKFEKGARNFEIAKEALIKSPHCAKLQLFAAEALMLEEKYDEAEKYMSEAMKNSDRSIWPERVREGYKQWLNIYLHMADSGSPVSYLLTLGVRVYSEAVSRFPDDPDFDVLISLLYFKAKDIKNTIRFFSASLSKNGGRISEGLIDSNSEAYEKLREACDQIKKENIF